jgi:hypothetical protein
MTLELPAFLLADRLTFCLALASGPALEFVLARQPEPAAGAGLVLGLVLMLWQWRRVRCRPRQLHLSPSGAQVAFGTASGPVPAAGRRARLLGRTVVLHWHGRHGPRPSQGTLWITPFDLPGEALRSLRVALVAGGANRS